MASPPHSAPAPAPRAPLSRKTWIGIIAGVSVLVGGLAGFLFWKHASSRPPSAAITAFLDSAAGANAQLTFSGVDMEVYSIAEDKVRVKFRAVATAGVPLFTQVETTQYLRDQLGLDPAQWTEVTRLLAGPAGARLRALAGLGDAAPDLRAIAILRPTVAAGQAFTYVGSLDAERIVGEWSLSGLDGRYHGAAPAGEVRESFGPQSYVIGVADDMANLTAWANSQRDFVARISAARERYEAELEQARRERLAQLQGLVQPGTLFVGTAIANHRPEPQRIVLEITDVKSATGQVSALLRNEGGWSDARGFQGAIKFDVEAGAVDLTLATRDDQAIAEAGPLVDNPGAWTMTLRLQESGALQGASNTYEYRLARVSADDYASVKAELTASLDAALAATAVDTVYLGAAVSKQNQSSEPIMLRFTRQENQGALLVAELASPERASWKRTLRGTVTANRFRSGDRPLRLRLTTEDRVERAHDRSLFNIPWNTTWALRIEQGELTGEDDHFTYRLSRASAADLSRIQAAQAEAERRFFSIVKAGAAYDGVIKDDDGTGVRARLRITRVEPRDRTLVLVVESREQNGIFHEFSGTYDVDEGSLRLGSSGKGKYNPSGALRVPFFSRDSTFKVALQVESDQLAGKLEYLDWKLEFPLGAAVAVSLAGKATDGSSTPTGYPPYPKADGVYVLIADAWQLLPKNNGKVSYGLGAILNQVSDAAAMASGDDKVASRPTKLADLTFDGQEPVPTVDGDRVVIVAVGAPSQAVRELEARYPELKEYPQVEMAPTRKAAFSNKRVADLFRIAPGASGFLNTRVAATVTEESSGVYLLVTTSRLPAGTYAVSGANGGYELTLR